MPNQKRGKWITDATTRVVNCKNEAYDVYIGRPSKWGECVDSEV